MIKFGTDGWRAEIGREFTFDNVAVVSQALCNHIRELTLENQPVIVGYDNRFLSEKFAAVAAEVVSSNGIKTLLFDSSVPSQLTAFATKYQNASFGIMLTASHNPPLWNGFKIKENYGGSAQPETTQKVEKIAQQLAAKNGSIARGNQKNIEKFNFTSAYFDHLKKLVDINLIKNISTHIIIDPMFGSSTGLLKKFLAEIGVAAKEIRNRRDPLFGGINPEPIPVNLLPLKEEVEESRINFGENIIGIALDGDGDRIGGMDENGHYLSSHHIFSLLLKHLSKNKNLPGDVVKTFNISRLVEKQAQAYGKKLYEVPIGFKHIVKMMLSQSILLGGEESGGLGIAGHIPERDGILCGLILLELLAKEKKPVGVILDEIMQQHGYYYYNRSDLHIKREIIDRFLEKLLTNPPKQIADKPVASIETLDGIKLNFDDQAWILFRASGTEPLIRIYCEARTPIEVEQILGAGQKIVG